MDSLWFVGQRFYTPNSDRNFGLNAAVLHSMEAVVALRLIRNAIFLDRRFGNL